AILALTPVSFRYKEELDREKVPQFGLIAEDVEKVCPELVVRDDQGKAMTVRYDAVNAMLLNEFIKEHRKVQEQEATIAQLKSAMTNQMEAVTARLKEQEAQIQKVGAQVALHHPAAQTVANNE